MTCMAFCFFHFSAKEALLQILDYICASSRITYLTPRRALFKALPSARLTVRFKQPPEQNNNRIGERPSGAGEGLHAEKETSNAQTRGFLSFG
jgi:hypothetical protein